ncbi:MAG: hypothetical protein KGL56_01405 [Alphaproteobacteria bacterium]|nr:hypothetical protein [Alphaproteobacteria bacterium]MDE2498821.1 hypothetical protein [Alphaproteobacteria bacterium]
MFRLLRAARLVAAAGLCLVALAGCDGKSSGGSADKAQATPQLGVVLSADDAAHIGIRTAPIRAVAYTPQIQGYGEVSNFETLAQAVSEVTTAEAAARQSAATLTRYRKLAGALAVSRETLDAAEKQALTDEAALTLAQRKEATTYGRDAPWLTNGRGVLASLASGKLVLIHVTFPLSASPERTADRLTVQRIGYASGAPSWTTEKIWNAPADVEIPGRSYFALIVSNDLAEGDRLLVTMPSGKPVAGVLIPADAMVLNGDKAWYYATQGGGVFTRHVLDLSRPIAGGYFMPGAAPAPSAVVQGGSLLLARELNPPSANASSDED